MINTRAEDEENQCKEEVAGLRKLPVTPDCCLASPMNGCPIPGGLPVPKALNEGSFKWPLIIVGVMRPSTTQLAISGMGLIGRAFRR